MTLNSISHQMSAYSLEKSSISTSNNLTLPINQLNNTSLVIDALYEEAEEDSPDLVQTSSTEFEGPRIQKIELNSGETYHSTSVYKDVINNIMKGNVNPSGPIEDTPKGLLLDLKLHQKRLLSEMLYKETQVHRVTSGINAFVLADKVGAGKSLDVLALICKKPIVDSVRVENKLVYKSSRYSDFRGHIKDAQYSRLKP